jgi:signal peptidase I
MHWAKELGLLVAIAVLVVWPVRTFLAQAYYIPSASMTPQLSVNDRVVVSKLAYDLHDPHRGDIVVFDAPPGLSSPPDRSSAPIRFVRRLFQPSTQEFIKRVVALPGERVEARDGRILIDGKRVVPDRQLWVMGDNRSSSEDSRAFGPIRRSTVVGRAVVRVWPVRRMSFL